MKIGQVKDLLDAELFYGDDLLEREIKSACGADLMSDVLAFLKDKAVLLTGLTNPHVLRTAEMLDVRCIVFVRGKRPTEEMIEMAEEREIVLLGTEGTLYEACGKLYVQGLPATDKIEGR